MARWLDIGCSYSLFLVLALLHPSISPLEAEQIGGTVRARVSVVDAQERVVSNALCTAIDPDNPVLHRASTSTDENGIASLVLNWSGKVSLTVEKAGFRTLSMSNLTAGTTEDLLLNLTLQIASSEQSVNVSPQPEGIAATEGGPLASADRVDRDVLRLLPRASSQIEEALPLIPGVVRSSTGEINIKGADEDQSALRINGANVNDPVTGNFHLDLPSDSVDSIEVLQHPYTVENGQFVGGLTRVDTRRGSDKLKFEVNDFLPDVRIRNGHIRGFASDSPRAHISGPIQPNRLFFAQSFTYSIDKRPIRGLSFPYDETKVESGASFTQIDHVPNKDLIQTFTVSHARFRHQFEGLDFFHPQPTTTSDKDENTILNFHESRKLGAGILESLVSVMRFDFKEWPQGTNELFITPAGNSGNYFASEQRHSGRTELRESYAIPALHFFTGVHELSLGVDFSHLNLNLAYDARPVSILRGDRLLSERIVFSANNMSNPIRTRNQTLNIYFQDRWTVQSNLSVDFGVRYENQSIARQDNFIPRAAFAWSPFKSKQTTIRGGVGYFYDKVPLNIRSFSQLLPRTVYRYADDGVTLIDRIDYKNVLVDSAASRSSNANGEDVGFVPRNVTWNSEWVQTVTPWLSFRANLVSSRTGHLYIVDAFPDYPGGSAVVLHADGKSKYRAFESTAKFSLPQKRSILVSYVESRSRGDLNSFNSYFGDQGNPILRPNQYSNLPLSTPHRLIAWGVLPLLRRTTLSPVFEARSGFPYSVTDAGQEFVGVRNSDATRFPMFLALDMELAKEFQVTSKYGLRLSVSVFNLTSHFNPTSVHANIADPQFGQFFASYHRYFTGGFDILF